jgi:hypothetical protein
MGFSMEAFAGVGFCLGTGLWILLILSPFYNWGMQWLNDGEGEERQYLYSIIYDKIGELPFINRYDVNMFATLFVVGFPVLTWLLGSLLYIFIMNFLIPIVIVVLIVMAFITRSIKRVKRVFTKHASDESIHNGGK